MRRNPLQTRNFSASDVAPIEERFSLQAFVVKEYSLDGESKLVRGFNPAGALNAVGSKQ
jgi:hypothetical protein